MQNRINDQAAFILHRRDYQNSSLILDLFSEDYGRLSVLVKAAKKRRDVAHFQICNRLSVGWSGHSELKTLTQIDSFPFAIPAEYLPSVFYINELLLYLLPKHEEHRTLFQFYQTVLMQLSQQNLSLESTLRNFEIELLSELGYMPDLSFDTSSNQKVKTEAHYVFSEMSGIHPASAGLLNFFTGAELIAIYKRQFESAAVLRSAKRLMRQIIDVNLHGRTLQSRKFYQRMNKK